MTEQELREEFIHWLSNYDSLVEQRNAPSITETINQILALIKKAGYITPKECEACVKYLASGIKAI